MNVSFPSTSSSTSPGISIKIASSSIPNSLATTQLLSQIGTADVLDTATMKSLGLQSSFKDFDVTAITPGALGLVSKNLFALGLIDKTTANLLLSAGTSLDSLGNQTKPDTEMNALNYFSARIKSLNTANVGGDEYGFFAVPDYIKAVQVLQNLDTFAKQQPAPVTNKTDGSSPAMTISIRA
ncbi:MAG: hypothetical protein ACOH2T_26450 [Pseudomonas sp.]